MIKLVKSIMNRLEKYFTVGIDINYPNDYCPEKNIVSKLESGYQYIMF